MVGGKGWLEQGKCEEHLVGARSQIMYLLLDLATGINLKKGALKLWTDQLNQQRICVSRDRVGKSPSEFGRLQEFGEGVFGLNHRMSWWLVEVVIQVDLGYLDKEEPLEIEGGELTMLEER